MVSGLAEQERRSWQLNACCVVAIVGLVLVAYRSVQYNAYINYDDSQYIISNEKVQSGLSWDGVVWAFTTTSASNWHPLTWISLQLDQTLFGNRLGAHHLISMLIHAVNALLLWGVLFRTTGARGRSLVAALLFAVHPIHVETVAWLSERKGVLCVFFLFLACHAYVSWVRSGRIRFYGMCMLAFVLGLMSKAFLVSLPFLLVFFDFWPLRCVRWEEEETFPTGAVVKAFWEKIPLFAISLLFSVVTLWTQSLGDSVRSVEEMGVGMRLANALTSYLAYLRRLFLPVDLAIFYPYPESIPWYVWGGALCLLVVISAWVVHEIRRKPFLFAGWGWFGVALVPVIGIVQVGFQANADRYTYLAFPMLYAGLVWWIGGIGDALGGSKWLRVLAVLVFGVLTGLTRMQVKTFRNPLTVAQHAAEVTRDNAWAHTNLGATYLKMKRYAEAEHHMREAFRIDPIPLNAFHVGFVLLESGDLAKAETMFRQTRELDSEAALGDFGLGLVALRRGQQEEAQRLLESAVTLDPDFSPARRELDGLQRRRLLDEADAAR